jgi:hypothetical protein
MPLSCMHVFLQVLSSCDQANTGNPDLVAANSPPDQVDFCTIIEDDGGQYSPLYRQAKSERNGNTLDQLNAQMATLFADRNKRVIDELQAHSMHASEWATSITKIAHYAQDGGGTVVEVALDAKCQVKTAIVIDLPDSTPLAGELNGRKVGDPLVVTGNFIMHYTDTIPPVRALEWGLTRSQSMLTPEYHIEVTRLGVKPPTS